RRPGTHTAWTSEERSVAAAGVLDGLLARRDPRHHLAELAAHLLDLVLAIGFAELLELAAPAATLGDPLLGELAALDLAEDLAHLVLHRRGDDARAASEVAVLGGVGDGVAH